MSRRAFNGGDAASGRLGALRWALLQNTGDATANHLLIVMGWRANSSFECYLAVSTMAKLVHCHARTVQHKIKHLLLLGFIEDISAEFPQRRTRTYRLNAPVVCF